MNGVFQRSKPRIYTKVVSRSAADKPDYICDGTDDDVQIQAAIDAVGAAGGGTVYIKRGTYIIGTQLDVDSPYVRVVGEGMGNTILQTKTAFTDSTAIVTLDDHYTTLENLTVDGNKANQTTQTHYGVYTNWSYSTYADISIISVEVKNMNASGSYGIGIQGARTTVLNCTIHDGEGVGLYSDTGSLYSKIIGVVSYSNTGQGFYLDGNYSSITDCIARENSTDGFDNNAVGSTMNGCIAHTNTGEGFLISGTDATLNGCVAYLNTTRGFQSNNSRNSFIGCYAYDNTASGIALYGASGQVVSGCKVYYNATHGIEVDTTNSIVSGNYVSAGDGLSADNTYSGIYIGESGSATRNVIVGNRIDGNGATNDYAYGIREHNNTSNYNNISANIATGSDTAQISTQGANTVVDGTNVTS